MRDFIKGLWEIKDCDVHLFLLIVGLAQVKHCSCDSQEWRYLKPCCRDIKTLCRSRWSWMWWHIICSQKFTADTGEGDRTIILSVIGVAFFLKQGTLGLFPVVREDAFSYRVLEDVGQNRSQFRSSFLVDTAGDVVGSSGLVNFDITKELLNAFDVHFCIAIGRKTGAVKVLVCRRTFP